MIKVSTTAKIAISELNNSSFKAYLVGGCVRDALLGKNPKDWDITTNATPEEILKTFENYKTLETGRKFGTISVKINQDLIEITTMRKETDYKDNRHPESVVFFDNIYEDLKRRDLTINAMAYDVSSDTLIDLFYGQLDLKNKIIKTVGNPDDRFKEDPLRMLRAIRFSAQLNFKIDYKTLYSITNNSSLLENIAIERIKIELDQILLSNNYYALRTLYNTGIFEELFPEIDLMFKTDQNNKYHIYNVGDHSLMSVINIYDDLNLKYAMLLHDIGKPIVKTTDKKIDHFYNHGEASVNISEGILTKLKLPTKDKNYILKLIKYHDNILSDKLKNINKYVVDRKFTFDEINDLVRIQKADALAKNPIYLERATNLDKILETYKKIYSGPHTISNLSINGTDLIPLGYSGKNIKTILEFLLKQVLADNNLNNRETLLEIAKKMFRTIERQNSTK